MVQLIRPIRSLAMSIGMVVALPWSSLGQADEIFPVVHNDTITVRVLNGKYGVPITHAHLTLAGGYDARDIGLGLWQEELLTDKRGEVRLPNGLANLPFLQIRVADHKLCQAHPKAGMFSVDRMRRDGLSAPNRCGTFAVEDAPGVFTVFVNGENGAPPVIHGGGGASPVGTPADLAAPTFPIGNQALAAHSVEASAPTNPPRPGSPTKPGSKPDLKAASGRSDSASAVSSSAVFRSVLSGSAAPSSAYHPDLAQPPFAGMDKFYFTTPSTSPTQLLAPIPVVGSSGHRASRAIEVPFPVSSAVERPTGKGTAGSTSSLSSAKVSSTGRARRPSKDASPFPSADRKPAIPASDSDPEAGSPRRFARKAVKAPFSIPSSSRKEASLPASTPASVPISSPASAQGPANASSKQPLPKVTPVSSTVPTANPLSAAKAATPTAAAPVSSSPKHPEPKAATLPSATSFKAATNSSPAEKAGSASDSAADKSPAAAAAKQSPGASAEQPAAMTAHPVRPATDKPHPGAYANPGGRPSTRKPRTPAAKPEKPVSSACRAIPEK